MTFVALAFIQQYTGPFIILVVGHILCGSGYFLLGPSHWLHLEFSLLSILLAVSLIGMGVACPQVSTLESLLLVTNLKKEADSERSQTGTASGSIASCGGSETSEQEEQAMKCVLKILHVILISAFYTGSLLGTAAGGLAQHVLRDYEVTYTWVGVVLFTQGAVVGGVLFYLRREKGLGT